MNRQMIEVETMRRGFDVLQELNRARLQKIGEHRKNGTPSLDDEDWVDAEGNAVDDEDWVDAEGNAVDELMILNAVEEAGEKAKEEIEFTPMVVPKKLIDCSPWGKPSEVSFFIF